MRAGNVDTIRQLFARPNNYWRLKMIHPDPTDEIRAIKRKLAAECDFDIHKIAERARRRQRESGRMSVTLPPRPVTAEGTTNKSFQRSGGSGAS